MVNTCRFFGIVIKKDEQGNLRIRRMSHPQFRKTETDPWIQNSDPEAGPKIIDVPKERANDCQSQVACHVHGNPEEDNWTARNLFAADVLASLEKEEQADKH